MILIIAAVVSILGSTSTTDAFQTPPGKIQTGISLSSKQQRRTNGNTNGPMRSQTPVASSSLHVLSNPRRRTSSSDTSGSTLNPSDSNNSNIYSPIIDLEIKNPLTIDLENANKKTKAKRAGGNSNNNKESSAISRSTTQTSTTTPPLRVRIRIPVVSGIAAAVQPLAERAAGPASTSTLFRAKHNVGDHSSSLLHSYQPSASAITKRTIANGAGTKKRARTQTTKTRVKTIAELDRFWPEYQDDDDDSNNDNEECPLPTIGGDDTVDYHRLLKGISVEGDTQIIGSKDHPDFLHPVVKLMHERKRWQDQLQKDDPIGVYIVQNNRNRNNYYSNKKKDKIALVVEGGGMRGCVSAGMVCAIHFLGLSDTIDVVYGSSAGAVIAAYFVSGQLPYFGPEVYYDALTTKKETATTNKKEAVNSNGNRNDDKSENQRQKKQLGNENNNNYHVIDRYKNDYFIDLKRMTRSIGLGLCDPRLLKDVWMRPLHGKPMMNLHYMFQYIMQHRKPIDYETFMERQKIQPLKVVASGLVSEKPVILSHENGHFDTLQDLCHSLHASCLLPGIAGPVMNVLKSNNNQSYDQRPNFFLRNIQKRSSSNDDYEPLADAMLSAPIPYDIAHEEGATHVLVIRSSPDGTNLFEIPSIVAWIGSRIYKRFFLKKNHLPSMYKRSQTEQRHQRIYAKAILELNERSNKPEQDQDQTMTIALEPGSEEVSHLETTREGIFGGVRLGFARAYDALVEDPELRGKGKEMALRLFPDEILDYDPSCYSSHSRSTFEQHLESTGIMPKSWKGEQGPATL